jgi:hypothetical protein
MHWQDVWDCGIERIESITLDGAQVPEHEPVMFPSGHHHLNLHNLQSLFAVYIYF